MDAKIIQFDKILLENSIYGVPLIQRRYIWGKEEVNQLMDDIIVQAKNNLSKQYFLSTIIIREHDLIDLDGYKHVDLYEGQQRITTISLIYYALYLFLRDNPELTPPDLRSPKVLLKYVFLSLEDCLKTKINLNSSDKMDYMNILNEKFEGNNSHMYSMFKLIQKRINKTNYRHILTGLRKLKIVLIQLSPEDNADEIFNTVNTRGKSLSFIDELRNICLLNYDPEIQKEKYHSQWEPFYNSFTKYGFNKQHVDTEWVKGFVILHNIFRCEKGTRKNMIKYLRSCGNEVTMNLISEYTDILVTMIETSKHKKQISELVLISSLVGIIGVYLIEQAQKRGQINLQEENKLINLLTSMSIRSWIIGQKGIFNRMVDKMSKIISSNPLDLYQEIHQLFLHFETKYDLSNDKLIDKINSKVWINSKALIMLTLLETRLNVRCGNLHNMSLEHILPVKSVLNIEDDIKNRLGNLTILPLSENSRLSNSDFITKKEMEGGFNESTFMIDEYIKQQEQWGASQIEERTNLLAQSICDVWAL